MIDRSGIGCEPASTTTLAGACKLVQRGIIKQHECVVGILTGALLKDSQTGIPQQRHDGVIEANIEAVRNAIWNKMSM